MTNENNAEDQEQLRKKEHELAKAALHSDLKDSPEDEEKMKVEEVIIDLPDVSDIPGQ